MVAELVSLWGIVKGDWKVVWTVVHWALSREWWKDRWRAAPMERRTAEHWAVTKAIGRVLLWDAQMAVSEVD